MNDQNAIKRMGDFSLVWGESLCWDENKQRLYFVDCATKTLLWLNNAELPLHTMKLPSLPTGLGLAEDGRIVVALDDGLNLVDPDTETVDLLTRYPQALGKRANDATIDKSGNFVTGTLQADPGEGSVWLYSTQNGWWQLDDGITNANGHVALHNTNGHTVVVADSPAQKLFAYDYTSSDRAINSKVTFADTAEVNGFPDGACPTAEGGLLSCLIRRGALAHYTNQGLQQLINAGSEQPSDVTFGGTHLDRLFVVSIAVDFGHGRPTSPLAGTLVEVENSGLVGLAEHRFKL